VGNETGSGQVLATPVAIVGGGVMGSAIASGLVAQGWVDVAVVERMATRREQLASEPGLRVTGEVADAVPRARVVVLAVKPKDADGALDGLAPLLADGALLISICAGVTLARLASHLPAGIPAIRVIPNTPAQIGQGMTAVSPGPDVSDDQLALANRLLEAVGRTVVLPETLQDAATAVSGSGPAYVFYLAEAMIEAGVQLGLTRAESTEMVVQTILGSAQLLALGEHPTVLRERVTSPGGTTAAAIRQLDAHATRAAVADAIQAAHDVSRG